MVWWVFIFPLLRGLEQLLSISRSSGAGYTLSKLWRILDLIMSCIAIACIVLFAAISSPSDLQRSGGADWHKYQADEEHRDSLITLMAVLCIFTSARFLEAFCTFGHLGETLTIVLFMIGRLVPFMLTFIVLAIGFGAAFAALVQAAPGATLVANPIFFPFWALVGELGFVLEAMENVEARPPEEMDFPVSSAVNRPTVTYLLFFIFGFLLNVILINLVIAQMTTAYAASWEAPPPPRAPLCALSPGYATHARSPPLPLGSAGTHSWSSIRMSTVCCSARGSSSSTRTSGAPHLSSDTSPTSRASSSSAAKPSTSAASDTRCIVTSSAASTGQ